MKINRSLCLLAGSLAGLLVATGMALSCSDHEDPAVGRDRLAETYVGALDILPVVAAARRQKQLPPANPMAGLWTDRFPLQRHIRAIERFESLLNTSAHGRQPLTFAMVRYEPMLWTRYSGSDGRSKATIHTEGAETGELVLITAEDVVAIINDGRSSINEAFASGLLRLHGSAADVKLFIELYGEARGGTTSAS